jgi:hypothetical protein
MLFFKEGRARGWRLAGMLAVFFVLAGCGGAKQQEAVTAPEGWNSRFKGDGQILTHVYAQGKMTIHISAWENARGRDSQNWLQENRYLPIRGERVKRQDYALNKGKIANSHYVLRQLKARGGKSRSSLLLVCANGGKLRRVDTFGPASLFSGSNRQILRDSLEISRRACNPGQVGQVSIQAGGKEKQEQRRGKRLKRPKFRKGKPPQKLDSVWYVAEFVVGINGYQSERSAVLNFSDSRASTAFTSVFADGTKKSRRKDPGKWGKSRIRNGDLEVKWDGSRSFEGYYLSIKTRPGKTNEKITGCWSSSFGYTLGGGGSAFGGGSTSFATNAWCFDKNGRFSNDRSVSLSGSTGASANGQTLYAGHSKSDRTGWYRIDGHVLQLVYDNDNALTTSIGFVARKGDKYGALLLGSGYYD